MVLIDTGKLDFSKTYIALEIGTSGIAKIIQGLSQKIYPSLKPENIASHAFALRFIKDEWMVWEFHLKWCGCKQYPLTEYLEDYEKNGDPLKGVVIKEYPLNTNAMDYYIKFNPGYSVTNLFEIAEQRLIGLKLPDTQGFVCSEGVAACALEICTKMDIKLQEITPADLQVFVMRGMR
jgi:hypothetical protein